MIENKDNIKDFIFENEDFDVKNDLCNGQIYLIKNKINNKCYIGQALCFTGSNNSKWGTLGRWKSHLREAFKNNQDHCRLLNNALRKYGEENFEISTLFKCNKDDLDNYEIEFIKKYNSIQPNGYNIKSGGYSSKNSEETILKMQQSHLGIRREKYKRKNEEDNDLPKYIKAYRNGGMLIAYVITKFPIGIEKVSYLKDIYFRFTKYKKEEALELAIEHLNKLKEEYKYINDEIFKEKSIIKPIISLKEKKESIFKSKLPEFIFPIIIETKLKGYYVDGILDHEKKLFPRKDFVEKTNRWNLNSAKKYVEQLNYYALNKIDLSNLNEIDISGKNNKNLHEKYYLPKYINICNILGEIRGFMINGYPCEKYKCGKFKKAFTNEKISMDENYRNCIDFFEKFKLENPINTTI